jgi:hypothetical protein
MFTPDRPDFDRSLEHMPTFVDIPSMSGFCVFILFHVDSLVFVILDIPMSCRAQQRIRPEQSMCRVLFSSSELTVWSFLLKNVLMLGDLLAPMLVLSSQSDEYGDCLKEAINVKVSEQVSLV